jgi:SAM-dependent MidA family methyltransferase
MSGGSIGFAEVMQHVLYAPGLGYYVTGSRKIVPHGDFVTAHEVSPLFGRVLGRQCALLLEHIENGSMLELGAGSGALAVELLGKLGDTGILPEKYLILEPSADLQARQKRRIGDELPEVVNRVEWISAWPTHFRGVVVANEVADALPVARFAIRQGVVHELRVTADKGRFMWLEIEAPAGLATAVRQIEQDIGEPFPEGYVSEVCLALPDWIGQIADCILEGFVFLFDYGLPRRELYASTRNRGWLRCHFRHRAHDDPLLHPGIQDVTSWVDFSAIAEAAVSSGMQVSGFTSQAQFLLHGGLQDELVCFPGLSDKEQIQLSQQVKLLTLPGEMGENFKCIGLSKASTIDPAVFEVSDRAHTL